MVKSIGIYGSCVSRDAIEYLATGPTSPKFYVARQSLISAFGPPVSVPIDLSALDSPFRRRCVEGDIAGNLEAVLSGPTGSVDLLLWDLTDERGGVFETPDGGRLTPSDYLLATDFSQKWKQLSILTPFGSERYLHQFQSALREFKNLLIREGLFEKSLFLCPQMATEPTPGVKTGLLTSISVRRYANKLEPTFAKLRDFVRELGFPTLLVPSEVCTYSPQHQWGADPYHYSRDFYSYVARAIEKRLDRPDLVNYSTQGQSFSISQPAQCGTEDVEFIRYNVERFCSGADIELEIADDQEVKITLKFRDKFGSDFEGWQTLPGNKHQVALGRGGFSCKLTWQTGRYLESVMVESLSECESSEIIKFSVLIH